MHGHWTHSTSRHDAIQASCTLIKDCQGLPILQQTSPQVILTDCRYGRQLHAAALALRWLGGRVDPGAGVPHCLQPFLLDVLQLDGDRANMTHSFSQLKPHPSLLSPSGNGGVNHGAIIQCAEVPEAAPAVQGHLYSTVVVVGAAERRRLTAT